MSHSIQSCYACDRPATTREHVPPKCLFPESVPGAVGSGLRSNLITVPSCDEHNAGKSRDDEYLRFVLAGNVLANGHAERLVETRVSRSANRSPGFFANLESRSRPVVLASSADNAVIETKAVPLDGPRLERSLILIAKGIYLTELGNRWPGQVRVVADFVVALDGQTPESVHARALLNAAMTKALEGVEWKGENPDVFRYAFTSGLDQAAHVARLAFYDSCTASVFYLTDR